MAYADLGPYQLPSRGSDNDGEQYKPVKEPTMAAKKPPLGTGQRFAALKDKLAEKGAKDPGALAAAIGRRVYGKQKFQEMAAKGRSRAQEEK